MTNQERADQLLKAWDSYRGYQREGQEALCEKVEADDTRAVLFDAALSKSELDLFVAAPSLLRSLREELLTERQKNATILRLKSHSALCPDHRDKFSGRPCPACSCEALEARIKALTEALAPCVSALSCAEHLTHDRRLVDFDPAGSTYDMIEREWFTKAKAALTSASSLEAQK